MPRFAIVIDDPDVAHEQEIQRSIRGHMALATSEAHRRYVEAGVRAHFRAPRAKGTVHAEADSECPVGLTNCRNCGDPDHAESCRAAGHCPDCGTTHGIAPDAVIRRHGYVLQAR